MELRNSSTVSAIIIFDADHKTTRKRRSRPGVCQDEPVDPMAASQQRRTRLHLSWQRYARCLSAKQIVALTERMLTLESNHRGVTLHVMLLRSRDAKSGEEPVLQN